MKHIDTSKGSPPMKRNAGVTFIYGENVVLAKRAKFWRGIEVPLGEYWSPFAGAIEEKENPMMAALRELEEETGIKKQIHELSYIATYTDESSSFAFYVIEVNEIPEIKLNEEHTEVGVFKINALNCFPEKIDERIVKGLYNYIKIRDGGGVNLSEK